MPVSETTVEVRCHSWRPLKAGTPEPECVRQVLNEAADGVLGLQNDAGKSLGVSNMPTKRISRRKALGTLGTISGVLLLGPRSSASADSDRWAAIAHSQSTTKSNWVWGHETRASAEQAA